MRVRLYAYSVGVTGLAALVAAAAVAPADLGSFLPVLLFLGVLRFLTEWFSFSMSIGGSVSLAFAMEYAAVLLGGPLAGAVVALFGGVTRQDVQERHPPHRIAFNSGQLALSAVSSGTVFLLLGGSPLMGASQSGGSDAASWLLAALAAAVAQATVNMVLVGVAISMASGVGLGEIWRRGFRSYMVSLGSLTLLGLVLAQLVSASGGWGVLLLVVPFFVSRQTFQVYQDLAAAYRDTIHVLVAVLEAKDPYTRGHSERVAVYAREIAEDLGLSEVRVQRLEFAALLHDIGKVGISAATLVKPSRLSESEFDEIKLHPVTGSSLLQEVEFLSDATPFIESHHERLDGSGYPYGLAGRSLPLESQILAVADSFDAMTSDRSYRSAVPYSEAVEELLDSSPQRLNPDCVKALTNRVDESKVAELLETSVDLGGAE